jgi:hypothetical protein
MSAYTNTSILKGSAFVAILLLGFLPAYDAAVTASSAIEQLRQLAKDSFTALSPTNGQEEFSKFRELISNVGSASASLAGVTSEESRLLRVAAAVNSDPRKMNELVATYGGHHENSSQLRVERPSLPKAMHLNETYRPAWEALILAPESESIRFMQRSAVIAGALAKIGNTNSIPVLEFAFALTCQEGIDTSQTTPASMKQFRILEALSTYASKEALEAMLRCLSRSEAVDPARPPQFSSRTLREWIVSFLSGPHYPYGKGRWENVLKTFPKEKLLPDQRDLLEHAMRQQ